MANKIIASVIIPTYNYDKYINDAIKSIYEQSFHHSGIEVIVVDDGSTDNTIDVLQHWIQRGFVKYYYQENRGKASATWSAIQKCSGDYIFTLDADDYYLPDKLSESIKIFESSADIVHVANPAKFIIDGEVGGVELLPKEILKKKLNGTYLLSYFYSNRILFGGGSTFSARADILKNIDIPVDIDMYIDEYLVLATLSRGFCYFHDQPLSVWRGHGSNYTTKKLTSEAKAQRMLNSSKGILTVIEKEKQYSDEIRKLYGLHHYTRTLHLKEQIRKKTLLDIISFGYFVLIKKKYSLKQLITYSTFNRLLPTPVINLFKRA